VARDLRARALPGDRTVNGSAPVTREEKGRDLYAGARGREEGPGSPLLAGDDELAEMRKIVALATGVCLMLIVQRFAALKPTDQRVLADAVRSCGAIPLRAKGV
jgi:hypothetical protein